MTGSMNRHVSHTTVGFIGGSAQHFTVLLTHWGYIWNPGRNCKFKNVTIALSVCVCVCVLLGVAL